MSMSFRIRIGASSERVSGGFILRLLPVLGKVRSRTVSTVQLMAERLTNDLPFIDVRALDWKSAADYLKSASGEGANVILLSEKFLDWRTPHEAINEDLERFESASAAASVDIVLLESFSDRQREELPSRFDEIPEWHKATVADVLQEMVKDYITETLVWPYGNLPYILLDPELDDCELGRRNLVRGWVGFQPWQYERVLSRWPVLEFPMKHVTGRVQGRAVPENLGAVPFLLELPAREHRGWNK